MHRASSCFLGGGGGVGGGSALALWSSTVLRATQLGAFFDYAGPLTARLRNMPRVNWVLCDALAHYLSDPAGVVASSFPWARSLAASMGVVRSLWASFQPWEVAMATKVLPTAPLFLRAGDSLSAPTDCPPRMDLQPLQDLRDAAVNARGVHHVSTVDVYPICSRGASFLTSTRRLPSPTESAFYRSPALAASHIPFFRHKPGPPCPPCGVLLFSLLYGALLVSLLSARSLSCLRPALPAISLPRTLPS